MLKLFVFCAVMSLMELLKYSLGLIFRSFESCQSLHICSNAEAITLSRISKYWLVHFKCFRPRGGGRGGDCADLNQTDINPGCIIRGTLINISAESTLDSDLLTWEAASRGPQTPKRTRKIPQKPGGREGEEEAEGEEVGWDRRGEKEPSKRACDMSGQAESHTGGPSVTRVPTGHRTWSLRLPCLGALPLALSTGPSAFLPGGFNLCGAGPVGAAAAGVLKPWLSLEHLCHFSFLN